ncbi:hypothetical protein HDU76_012995 [Blyttiomyces sp. JEL0837]|nr:hypothetical protein HDU76_012995 [Blyttiomyces sp. JEL0837]
MRHQHLPLLALLAIVLLTAVTVSAARLKQCVTCPQTTDCTLSCSESQQCAWTQQTCARCPQQVCIDEVQANENQNNDVPSLNNRKQIVPIVKNKINKVNKVNKDQDDEEHDVVEGELEEEPEEENENEYGGRGDERIRLQARHYERPKDVKPKRTYGRHKTYSHKTHRIRKHHRHIPGRTRHHHKTTVSPAATDVYTPDITSPPTTATDYGPAMFNELPEGEYEVEDSQPVERDAVAPADAKPLGLLERFLGRRDPRPYTPRTKYPHKTIKHKTHRIRKHHRHVPRTKKHHRTTTPQPQPYATDVVTPTAVATTGYGLFKRSPENIMHPDQINELINEQPEISEVEASENESEVAPTPTRTEEPCLICPLSIPCTLFCGKGYRCGQTPRRCHKCPVPTCIPY